MDYKIKILMKKGYTIQEIAYRLNISIENINFVVIKNIPLSNSFIDNKGKCVLKYDVMENYFFSGELREVIKEFYQRIKTIYYPTLEKFDTKGNEKVYLELKNKYKEIKKEYDDYFYSINKLSSLKDAENYAEKLKNYFNYFENFKLNA